MVRMVALQKPHADFFNFRGDPSATHHMKFQGSKNYVATQDLMLAVNASATLKKPLLVKGEPGTGKTMLAEIGRAHV